MRIWYQSFVDPEQHAPYVERLGAYLSEIAGEGVAYEIAGISPPDVALSRLTEFRCAIQTVENALEAEKQGYDAFLLGHFQDSGLYEARSAVDIPVVGLGEASMLYALTLGRGTGLITIDPLFVSIHWEQAERYGIRDRLVGVAAMSTPVADLVGAFESDEAYARVRNAFEAQALPLVEAGAEVLIPAGGLFGVLSARERGFSVGDAVVVNPVAVAAKWTEAAVRLLELTGTAVSRAGAFFKAPSQAIEEFRARNE